MRLTPEQILAENSRRNELINAHYNPYTGEGSFSQERRKIAIAEYEGGYAWLPVQMFSLSDTREKTFMQLLEETGSFSGVAESLSTRGFPCSASDVAFQFTLLRIRFDFEFWAVSFIKIKPKAGSPAAIASHGRDVPFKLNRGQRKYLKTILDLWFARKPIRIILLKARQWGGSTLTQIFMMWIQFVHFEKWNSVICAHVKDAAGKIEGMYKNAIDNYPFALDPKQRSKFTFKPYMGLDSTRVVSGRDCQISIGTAERPNSLRSSDISLAHFSEVAFYKNTDSGSAAEEFVRNVNSSVAPVFGTMIVYESTADGIGDFFYKEWTQAKLDEENNPNLPHYSPVFIAWYDIEAYSIKIEDYDRFIREMTDDEYRLFSHGATLEQINWYRWKSTDVKDKNRLHSEFPSNDIEAFISTGRPYFPIEDCKRLEATCMPPMLVGEIMSNAVYGSEAMEGIRFVPKQEGGRFKVWSLPDKSVMMPSRYVVIVDVNRGLSAKADNGIICVIDRYWMTTEGGKPEVVAEWCGHEIMRYYAWIAARIAKFYNDAYLIIESNTPESTSASGYQLDSILDEIAAYYDNMFYRLGSPQDAYSPPPRKYGFNTNRQTKPTFCEHHQVVLANDLYIERCLEAAIEHETFEYKEDGTLGAANASHDDRLITRALGIYIILQKMDPPQILDNTRTFTSRKKITGEATM